MIKPIPDRIREGLDILFVGYNPSLKSGEVGHNYANPNNRFWTILHRSGLTPRKWLPVEDDLLLDMGYGFTNIVARPTRAAEDITKIEYEEGRHILKNKIEKFRPKIVCFVGKGVYEQYSKQKKVKWGFQEESVVPGVVEFVAPSSSGLVRMNLEEVVSIYKQLKQYLEDGNSAF